MVDAIAYHKMVASVREIMGHAKEVLDAESSDLENQIAEAKENLDVFFETTTKYPEAPANMEFISMLNPARTPETKGTWREQIKRAIY